MTLLASGSALHLAAVLSASPVTWGAAVGAAGLLAGRYVAPQIAELWLGRGPIARAGLDAALGCAFGLTATLLGASPTELGATMAVVAGCLTALGVAWGSGRGARPSGGTDDLAGGRARRLGAWLGVLAASPVVLA